MTDNAIEKICKRFLNDKHYVKLPETIKLNESMAEKNKEIGEIIGANLFDEILLILVNKENQCEEAGFVTGFKYAMQLMLASIGKE